VGDRVTSPERSVKEVRVATQAELDAALAAGDYPILVGDGYFVAWESSHVEARESSHVVARESSHVVAWESSHVVALGSSHVEARESSHVEARESSHVVAWGSSHVVAWGSSHVEARESSHVVAWESSHVEAWGAAQVIARGAAKVIAAAFCAVTILSAAAKVEGGVQIKPPDITTGSAWCEYQAVDVGDDGIATLFKAVDAAWCSPRGFAYQPGTTVEAPDWDGGKEECGGGLHFVPHASMAPRWMSEWKHIVACPVRVEDIAAHGFNADYPDKCKAARVCAPIFEVDINGKRIDVPASAAS
jgi:hypothetical protein